MNPAGGKQFADPRPAARWTVPGGSRAVAGNLAMRARYLARKTMAEKQKEEERRRRETEAREREEAELLRQLEEQRARASRPAP